MVTTRTLLSSNVGVRIWNPWEDVQGSLECQHQILVAYNTHSLANILLTKAALFSFHSLFEKTENISSLKMSLPLRTLGRDGPQISAVGYGFGSLSGFYGQAGTFDDKVAILDRAHAAGLRFLDMADVYGDSEDVVGEWIKRSGKRNDVLLTTKFALQRQPDGRHTFRSDPEYVKEACERSLKRLGVRTIDLYYCHRVDGITPIEKTVEAMVELKKYVHLPLDNSTQASDFQPPVWQARQDPISRAVRSLSSHPASSACGPSHFCSADGIQPVHTRH